MSTGSLLAGVLRERARWGRKKPKKVSETVTAVGKWGSSRLGDSENAPQKCPLKGRRLGVYPLTPFSDTDGCPGDTDCLSYAQAEPSSGFGKRIQAEGLEPRSPGGGTQSASLGLHRRWRTPGPCDEFRIPRHDTQ